MKTQKIFLLAVALVLALSVLASCGANQTWPDCFVFNDDEPSFAEPVEVDGEIIAVNEEYNLVAFETRSLGTDGNSSRTVKVIDVQDENRVLYYRTQTFSADSTGREDVIDLTNYPVIKVHRYSFQGYDSDSGQPKYKDYYDYYLIQKNREAITLESSAEKDELYVEEVNNVWLVEDSETLYWVNKNLAVMREIPLDVSETYRGSNYDSFFNFEAEYNDYLYTWEFDTANLSQVVIVYDPNGIACAKYTFPSGMYLGKPFVSVLNDGNVVIQEQHAVEDGEDFDYTYGVGADACSIDIVTKIMNYKTGEVAEVEFDYLILMMQSAYMTNDSNSPYTLADGFDNAATLIEVKNGALGERMETAVLSNGLEIQWKLENEYLEIPTTLGANEKGYVAEVYIDGAQRMAAFTWDGELITVLPTNFEIYKATKDVYVTESGVYNWKGELVFDIENSKFAKKNEYGENNVYVIGDCVYFSCVNELKLGEWDDNSEKYDRFVEYYKLNLETGEAELICDGEETFCEPYTNDGALVIFNAKKNITTVYNAKGEVVLVVRNDEIVEDVTLLDGAFIIEVEVDEVHKFYVFDLGDQKPDMY